MVHVLSYGGDSLLKDRPSGLMLLELLYVQPVHFLEKEVL